jgi:multicomponent Na+:H+ antiporter subunit D
LGGLAHLAPLLGVLYFVPAMNLAGIPPLSGFVGKLGLFRAGVAEGGWLVYTVVAAGALTSLLTLYAVARIWNVAFWRSPLEAENPEPVLLDPSPKGVMPATIVAATAAMVAVGVLLAVAAGPLWSLCTRATEDLVDRNAYIRTVLQ